MVRHGRAHEGRTRWTPSYRHLVVTILCILTLVTAILVAWWWSLIMRVDPIDADPVRAAAVVVTSPPCSDGDLTVARYVDADPGGTTELAGCGFMPGKRVAVEYLAGSPEASRIAGTSTAGVPQPAKVLLPMGIALCGLAAIVAAGMLIAERGRRRRGTITVADLQQRLRAGTERAATDAAVADEAEVPSWSTDPGPADSGSGEVRGGDVGGAPSDSGAGP